VISRPSYLLKLNSSLQRGDFMRRGMKGCFLAEAGVLQRADLAISKVRLQGNAVLN